MKEILLTLQQKLDEIANIGFAEGKDFDGIVIDDYGIDYKTSTYFSGCGTDTFTFHINWDELENSIDWWKEEYKRLQEIREKEKEENRKRVEKEDLERKKRAYELLKKEFAQKDFGP